MDNMTMTFADIFDESQLETLRRRWCAREVGRSRELGLSDDARDLSYAFELLLNQDGKITPSDAKHWQAELEALDLSEMATVLTPYLPDVADEYMPSMLDD